MKKFKLHLDLYLLAFLFVPSLLVAKNSDPLLAPVEDIVELGKLLGEFYIDTLPIAEEKATPSLEEEIKKERNAHNQYKLNQRGIASAHFRLLSRENKALLRFFDQINAHRAILHPKTAQDLRIISREPSRYLLTVVMPNGTQIGKIAMLFRFMFPLKDIPYLEKEQQIVKIMVKEEPIYEKLASTFLTLEALEPVAISLLRGAEDYLFSYTYKKELKALFKPNKAFKYTHSARIEAKKRVNFEGMLFASLFFQICCIYIITKLIQNFPPSGMRKIMGPLFVGCICVLSLGMLLFLSPMLKLFMRYYQTLRYISKRIGEFQAYFAHIAELHAFLEAHPALYQLLAPKLESTRRLLALEHPNAEINQLIQTLQRRDFEVFRWYHLFTRSTGELLTTMSAIETHIQALAEVFFEFGMLETYFATAKLMKKHQGQPNAFAFPEYVEREKILLEASAMWNPLLDPSLAKSNTIYIDGNQTKTLAITGANGTGKSAFSSLLPITFDLVQVLTIGPASPHAPFRVAPVALFLSFKEPQDALERGKSLFTVESEQAAFFLELLMEATEKKWKSILLCDEFFVSTNIPQQLRLQFAYTNYINRHAPYNLIVISTHNEDLIKKFVKSPDAVVMKTRIERFHNGQYWDYRPLFQVVDGASHEKVGFILFYKKLLEYEKLQEAAEEILEEAQAKK